MKFNIEKNISNHVTVPHGGLYSAGMKPDSKIIDFSSNVNPLGFPQEVKNMIKKNLEILSIYPDPNSTDLRNSLEKYTGIKKNQIIIGNGATEIIYNFCKAFIKKNTTAVIPIPTFEEYEAATLLQGGRVFHFKTMNLNEKILTLQSMITKNKCVFLCNPNNPTGKLVKRKNMLKILETTYEKSALMFVDECFIELVPESNESLTPYLKEFDNLFILRSLTKSFGLAGLRIGYGLGSKKMIDILRRIKIPWNVNALAQKAAILALSNKSHLYKTRELIKNELDFLTTHISKLKNFSYYPSSTNFVLLESKLNSKSVQKKLIKEKILIRDCSTFHGLNNRFIRVAVRKHKDNVKLVKALGKI